jgi:hypothetical protein
MAHQEFIVKAAWWLVGYGCGALTISMFWFYVIDCNRNAAKFAAAKLGSRRPMTLTEQKRKAWGR